MRVISRLRRRAKAVLGKTAAALGEAFHSRVRTVRKLAPQLHRRARCKKDQGRPALKAVEGRRIAT